MQHASLSAIGRRDTIETQDSLSDSFEKNGSKDISCSPELVSTGSPSTFSQPLPLQVFRLDEALEHLLNIKRHLHDLHTSKTSSTAQYSKSSEETSSFDVDGQKLSLVDEKHSKSSTRCVRLGEFVRTATKAVELHVALVRLETLNSSLVELSQSVDLMVEQEFANVSAGATSLINALIHPSYGRLPTSITKTKISSVRGICEGLRQGLSLVSRTNTLLVSEFGDLAPIPGNSQKLSLMVISVLIAASHIVNSGLLLLSQSDLTRYTHTELWEITRGIEELSMLTERVQEQLDEKKQLHLRQLLLHGHPFTSTSKHLEQKLAKLSLLTDPIDSLRPASVGHIIYLLARYRSTTLATFHVQDLLKALRNSSGIVDFLNEVVRKEYEFCSNFLDVMTQSTELLRNLKKVQESVDGHPKSILHKTDLVSPVQRLNLKAHRKPVYIAKTVSIDKFISAFPERPSKQVTTTTPIEEGDEEGGEKLQKKIVQWSDYYEVTLRHQVVGRYLQLTWIGLSEEFDSLLQLVVPTDLKMSTEILPPWPLLNKQELYQLTNRLQELETQDGIPVPIKSGIFRQRRRMKIYSNSLDWLTWPSEKRIIEEDNCDVFCTPICGFLRDLLSEILSIKSTEIDDWLNQIPSNARKCFDRLGLDYRTIPQTEFSHRLFRIHLDQFLRLLNKFTTRVLIKYGQLLTDSQITMHSPERITNFALNSSRNFAFCLSFLDLLHFAIDYFCVLKRTPYKMPLLSDIVGAKFEATVTLSRLALIETTTRKLRNAQHTIALSHDLYWKKFAIKQTTNQNARILSTPGPNVAEIDEFCSTILAALEVFSRCKVFAHNGIDEFEQDETDRTDFAHQRICTRISHPIIDATLLCLETRFIKITEPSNSTKINSLLCLLAKLLAAINQLEEAELSQSEKQKLLSRCVSLTDKFQSRRNERHLIAFSNSCSPSQTKPKETVLRLKQYISDNVLTPLHSSDPLSTLGTLSANVRAYFQNEDLVSRSFGSSAKSTYDKR
nr:hypothetical transcript [Hymenolepis microstoma]